jgi:hypothetical protein
VTDEILDKTHSSFAVAVEPEFDDEGKWTGSISAHIEEDVKDDLSDEELLQIRSVCGMMASTLLLMENDEDFLDYVKGFFFSNNEDMINEMLGDIEDKPNFTKEGNVITLNFDTKTHGSA